MKLLFDENLAHYLVGRLATLFPGSAHVHEVGLERADASARVAPPPRRSSARAGHSVMVDNPEGCRDAICAFVLGEA